MAHYIRLKEKDLETLIEIVQLVTDYKFVALSSLSYHRYETKYLPSIVDALRNNSFKHVRSDDNIFRWLEDQVHHSRRLAPGIKHFNGTPLAELPIGKEAIEICKAASKGQISYDQFRSTNNFHDLFQ
jgi:hypothetical protein